MKNCSVLKTWHALASRNINETVVPESCMFHEENMLCFVRAKCRRGNT